MTFTFKNCNFKNNYGTAIDAPVNAEVSVEHGLFEGNQNAVRIRDMPSQLERLGFRADTPPDALAEVLHLAQAAAGDARAFENKLKESPLRTFLSVSSDLAQVASVIVTPAAVALLTNLISSL